MESARLTAWSLLRKVSRTNNHPPNTFPDHPLILFSRFAGLNLVVVSRTQSRLDDLAEELKTKYNIEVKTCAADLTKLDAATISRLGDSIKHLDVGVLINNAGMSYDHPEYLEQTSLEGNAELITINTIAPTLLAHILLLGMKERGRGVIVNIGSANGLLPAVPLLSAYAGSKAYINQFTRSLDVENRRFGVRVQDQCPMFVATKMSKIKRARLDAPTPQAWARAAVRQIGYDTVLTPYWYHGLMTAVVDLAPRFVVVKYVHDLHLAFRARFYKRQAKEALAAAAGSVEETKKEL